MDKKWNIVGTGDFNGDGKADILWQYTSGAARDLANERYRSHQQHQPGQRTNVVGHKELLKTSSPSDNESSKTLLKRCVAITGQQASSIERSA